MKEGERKQRKRHKHDHHQLLLSRTGCFFSLFYCRSHSSALSWPSAQFHPPHPHTHTSCPHTPLQSAPSRPRRAPRAAAGALPPPPELRCGSPARYCCRRTRHACPLSRGRPGLWCGHRRGPGREERGAGVCVCVCVRARARKGGLEAGTCAWGAAERAKIPTEVRVPARRRQFEWQLEPCSHSWLHPPPHTNPHGPPPTPFHP